MVPRLLRRFPSDCGVGGRVLLPEVQLQCIHLGGWRRVRYHCAWARSLRRVLEALTLVHDCSGCRATIPRVPAEPHPVAEGTATVTKVRRKAKPLIG